MNLKASDIMTQPVVAVNEAAPVKDLIQLLNEKSISGVPVVDDEGGLVGVISITDLLAANIGDDELGPADFHTSPSMDGLTELNPLLSPDEDIEQHPVRELMSRNSVTAPEDSPIGAMSKILVSNRIHRLVIVRDGRPIGIVSVGDILRALGASSD
jgi:CBS domain-containing protein